MFTKRRSDEEVTSSESPKGATRTSNMSPSAPNRRPSSPVSQSQPSSSSAMRTQSSSFGGQGRSGEAGRLVVGKDITLKGEISACNKLIVEGTIEASLNDCEELEVLQSGYYKGDASVEDAEIIGLFEGDLTVTHKLIIRSTGKVAGAVRYNEIEIENGGRVVGFIEELGQEDEANALRNKRNSK